MSNMILKHLLHSADQIATLSTIYYAFWLWYLTLVALEGFQGMLARSDFLPAYFFFPSSSLFLSLLYFLLLYKLRGADSCPLTQNQALEEQPDN